MQQFNQICIMIVTWNFIFLTLWICTPIVLTDDLVSVVVLFRHGDRSIINTFPKDPYQNISYWPEGYGELLVKGKKRHYYLGQWFQNRYGGLLPTSYKKSGILVRSSDSDRCLMSAASNLAGMFRVNSEHQWLKGLPWEPIPIHTRPEDEDPFLALNAPCPKRDKLIEEVLKSKVFTDAVKDNAALFKYISEQTGWNVDNVHYIQTLHSVMYTYSEHDESYIPGWYKGLNKTLIEYLAGLSMSRHTYTPELKKFVAGSLIHMLNEYFDKIISVEGTPKFLMLSAHDSTIVALLNAMNLFDYRPPQYAATIMWEMYKKSNGEEYYFNMFYKTYNWPALKQLKLKGCKVSCDYQTYKKILEPVTINATTLETECNSGF